MPTGPKGQRRPAERRRARSRSGRPSEQRREPRPSPAVIHRVAEPLGNFFEIVIGLARYLVLDLKHLADGRRGLLIGLRQFGGRGAGAADVAGDRTPHAVVGGEHEAAWVVRAFTYGRRSAMNRLQKPVLSPASRRATCVS